MRKENRFKERFNNLHMDENWEKRQRTSKIIAGLFIVTAGSLILVKQMGVEIPHWVLSWEMILIAIGFVSLIKHQFKRLGGYIMILIGSVFMLQDMMPDIINHKFLWPVLIIFFGVFMIFKSLFRGQKKNLCRISMKNSEM